MTRFERLLERISNQAATASRKLGRQTRFQLLLSWVFFTTSIEIREEVASWNLSVRKYYRQNVWFKKICGEDAEAMFQNCFIRWENLTYVTGISSWCRNHSKLDSQLLLPILISTIKQWAIGSKETPEQVIGDISIVKIDEADLSWEIRICARQGLLGIWYDDRGLESCLGLCLLSRFSKGRARYASLNPASGRHAKVECPIQTIVNGVERKGYLADLIYYGISGGRMLTLFSVSISQLFIVNIILAFQVYLKL